MGPTFVSILKCYLSDNTHDTTDIARGRTAKSDLNSLRYSAPKL
jgi:hypothetical protein